MYHHYHLISTLEAFYNVGFPFGLGGMVAGGSLWWTYPLITTSAISGLIVRWHDKRRDKNG